MSAAMTPTPEMASLAQQLRSVVGLDEKNATDLSSKVERAQSVLSFFAQHHVDVDAPRETKVMLYGVWTRVRAAAHRDVIARLICAKRLQTTPQVDAAVRYVNALPADSAAADVDVAALEAECGVGVRVSADEVARHVAAALRDEAPAALRAAWDKGGANVLLGKLRRLSALRWADVAHIKAAIEAQVPPLLQQQQEQQPDSDTHDAPSAAVAAAAKHSGGSGKATHADATRRVCPRNDNYLAVAHGLQRTAIGTLPCLLRRDRDDDAAATGPQTPTDETPVVYLLGWAHRVRHQSRMSFIVLRDGSGYVQCVLDGDVEPFHRETALAVRGRVRAEAKAQSELQPPLEVHVDEYAIIGPSDGSIETIVTADSSLDKQLDQRHVVLRGTHATATMKARHELLRAFREYLWGQGYYEVTPPTLVQTQCEGGSTLFDVLYYSDKAYLTQSSQLYLETVTASLGNVFCCMPSYRAEKSKTRRHLSEYTHLEIEYDVCTFEEMLDRIEDMICSVVRLVLARAGRLVALLNPQQLIDPAGDVCDPENYKLLPRKPFRRMRYSEAIEFCNQHGIVNSETGQPFVFGDDITEKPEREMVAKVGQYVLLTHFPAAMKSFYMQRDAVDETLTESVDVLAPGVGEIVGGSMRMYKHDELVDAFARKGVDPEKYYWYIDQRKYGGAPHGGFGLGIERMLVWLLDLESVKDACQFPRYMGRCTP